MTKIDIYKIEENGDDASAILDEVAREINLLINRGTLNDNNLGALNIKIDYLRNKGLNVDNLDNQIRDLRILLFKKSIENKIEELNYSGSNYTLDISKIQAKYDEIKMEKGIDKEELGELMDKLDIELARAKIRHMITDIQNSGGTSIHSIDEVVDQINDAKQQGYDVEDLEEMVFGE